MLWAKLVGCAQYVFQINNVQEVGIANIRQKKKKTEEQRIKGLIMIAITILVSTKSVADFRGSHKCLDRPNPSFYKRCS